MLGLEGLSNISIFAGGALTLLIGIFGMGYGFNAKIKAACAEATREMVTTMVDLTDRLNKLETAHVPIGRYERDLMDLKDLIKEIHNDVKLGLATLSTRIDTLLVGKI